MYNLHALVTLWYHQEDGTIARQLQCRQEGLDLRNYTGFNPNSYR